MYPADIFYKYKIFKKIQIDALFHFPYLLVAWNIMKYFIDRPRLQDAHYVLTLVLQITQFF